MSALKFLDSSLVRRACLQVQCYILSAENHQQTSMLLSSNKPGISFSDSICSRSSDTSKALPCLSRS